MNTMCKKESCWVTKQFHFHHLLVVLFFLERGFDECEVLDAFFVSERLCKNMRMLLNNHSVIVSA